LAIGQSSPAADSAVYVFTRPSSAQPWQPQTVLRSGKSYFGEKVALSSDGSTLAIQGMEPTNGNVNALTSVVYLYQRSGSTWISKPLWKHPPHPSACPPPCRARALAKLALSANGNLVATSINFFNTNALGTVHWRRRDLRPQRSNLVPTSLVGNGRHRSADIMALARRRQNLGSERRRFLSVSETFHPSRMVFTQQSNGTWSQQARIPVGIVYIGDCCSRCLQHHGAV
jgi:hypothetical protein